MKVQHACAISQSSLSSLANCKAIPSGNFIQSGPGFSKNHAGGCYISITAIFSNKHWSKMFMCRFVHNIIMVRELLRMMII